MPFIPWPAKWANKTYAPSATAILNNKTDVKFRFWYRNADETGQTQDLYIDQFNISGVVGLNELENEISLALYPNPTSSSSSTKIEFTAVSEAKGRITVYDVIGKTVEQISISANASETKSYTINAYSALTSGIYFVKVDLNNKSVTKKLVIE